MKPCKNKLQSREHKLPKITFEDQRLTSFSGLVVFQALFQRLKLKQRIKKCFNHQKVQSIFGHHVIVLLLIVHLLLGFRRLRGRDYYHDDPMVKRLLGLGQIPDVATISRALALTEENSVAELRSLSRELVLERLMHEKMARITLDFDGSVITAHKHAEGTAVGFNKKKKGARSYYPLFCTIAQTGQFLDMYHRPGNVHDSHGALEFIENCFLSIESSGYVLAKKESRLDSAFFSDQTVFGLHDRGVEFTITVPFERFSELKLMIQDRKRWRTLDDRWSYFETDWSPKKWADKFRFVFVRQRVKKQIKGPLQLDLFYPQDDKYDYKVIVTNKICNAKKVLQFHNGRGSQEGIFGLAKTDVALDYIPTRRLCANQIYTLSAMMAHNLSREIQMITKPRSCSTTEKRSPFWVFESLGSLRHQIIQRAGRFTKPQGELTLTLNTNERVKNELTNYLATLESAA